MKRIVTLWIAFSMGVCSTIATPLSSAELKAGLRQVPAAELPIVAAEMVKQSATDDQVMMTSNVLVAAVALKPAATPLIVGAMARAVPGTAPLAAAVAAAEQPSQIEDITRAAVAVAPAQLAQIVTAVCGAAPANYRSVAVAAGRAAHKASREILRAVGSARPDLKPYIEQEITACGVKPPSIGPCLDRAEFARSRANPPGVPNGAPGGMAGAPPGGATPQSGVHKPPNGNGYGPGGRNYARP